MPKGINIRLNSIISLSFEFAVRMFIKVGHTGARTQDLGVISTTLYRLSYTTSFLYTFDSIISLSLNLLLEYLRIKYNNVVIAGLEPAASAL